MFVDVSLNCWLSGSVDPGQKPRSAVSDLGPQCLLRCLLILRVYVNAYLLYYNGRVFMIMYVLYLNILSYFVE